MDPAEPVLCQKGAGVISAPERGITRAGGILAVEEERFSNALAELSGWQSFIPPVGSFIDDHIPPVTAMVFTLRADAPETRQVRRHFQNSPVALHGVLGWRSPGGVTALYVLGFCVIRSGMIGIPSQEDIPMAVCVSTGDFDQLENGSAKF
jgi:hypothetical protein